MQGKRTKIGARYFWMGFFLPLTFTLIAFIMIGVWPFGDGTVLIIDSLHQYLPFYTDFHEKLRTHSSLLYSFSAGLGYNFWATYAYYLASPVNFLMVLVPKANVCDFMDLSILLRIGLAGGTFTWYLHKRDKSSGALPVAFGSMYALSFFLIGYYFNLMWLDSIAMLPLIMRGIEKICGIGDNRRLSGLSDGRMYVLSLFYALWCNYYIGWMLCIFAVLYFIMCQIAASWMGLRLFLMRTLRFACYSLLAGGLGALVLYPAYRSLTASEAMQNNHFPSQVKFYDSFIDMLLTHFAGIKPINISNTQVGLNAYSGVVVLILVIFYVLDKKIRLREKIASLIVTAFLFLSFSLNILNYGWHGFHQQNGLPNRFAFLYVAMLLTMSYDAARHLKENAGWKIVLSGAIPVSFAIWAYITQPGKDHSGAAYPETVYWITLLLLIGYMLLLSALRFFHMRKSTAVWLLSAACIFEAGASAIWGVGCNDSVTRSIYLNDQKSYQLLTKEMNDPSWYRSEVDSQRMRDVTMFCGGHAVVMFNSTMMESVTNFCDRIGMEARTNKNGYNGLTKLMNDVLGIRYVLSANGKGSSLYQFQKVSGDGNLDIFRNEDALAIGFMVNPEILDWDIEQGTPIDVQNQFVALAAGQEPIYTLDRYITMKDGEENDAKTGAIMLAYRTDTPILPCFCERRRRPFQRTAIVFGEPYTLEFSGKKATPRDYQDAADDLLRRIYALEEWIQ